jgi:hypothetical protein
MKPARRSLRAEMPGVAAFVDALREAFGEETVNGWLRGEAGGWLCAEENGRRWCTPGRACIRCQGRKR